jgi:hypothetical protein
MDTLLKVILSTAATGVMTLLVASARWLLSINKTTKRIETQNTRRSKQMQVLFQVQLHLIKAQRTGLKILHRSNGKASAAYAELDAAEELMNQFANDEAWK